MQYPLALGPAAIVGLLLLAAGPAQSAGIHPACWRMKDRQGCSCALQNGGEVYRDPRNPGRTAWRISRKNRAAHMAFMDCSNRSSWR